MDVRKLRLAKRRRHEQLTASIGLYCSLKVWFVSVTSALVIQFHCTEHVDQNEHVESTGAERATMCVLCNTVQ